MGIISEFKAFALKGNVVDMAVGVIIGGAFGAIVTSLVNNVLMPVIGLVTGGVDFKDKKIVLKAAVPEVSQVVDGATKVVTPAAPEVALSWGLFINATIQFVIVAFALFMLIKAMNTAMDRMRRKEAAAPPPPPPGPTPDQALLMEIRDLLAARR